MNFNPIIVLFLTLYDKKIKYSNTLFQSYYSLISNDNELFFNGVICAFQSYYSLISNHLYTLKYYYYIFQSYYSLISNFIIILLMLKSLLNFNPIIVLFLTLYDKKIKYSNTLFQSYYSLISNHIVYFTPPLLLLISILL